MATRTYPDNGELDVEAYERPSWFFDPGAPARDELYFDAETMQYADEPDAVWFDLAINKAGDDGRVVNWANA